MSNEAINIAINSTGVGRRYQSPGEIELSYDPKTKEVTLSVSKRKTYYTTYQSKPVWAKLSLKQAHELAGVLIHLTGKDFPCQGDGPTVNSDRHQAEVEIKFGINIDLCTFLNDKESVKERMLKKAGAMFDKMTLPTKKTTEE